MKALLLESIHPLAKTTLEKAGFTVETRPGALDEDDLIAASQGVNFIGIRSKTEITEKVIASCPDLMGIGAFCIGTNQIDLQSAAKRGIVVFNAPYSNTRSVVELAISEIIMLSRRLADKNREMHAGVWNKDATGSHEIRGRKIGIVGYGNIGSQLSIVAEAMGLNVHYFDLEDKLALGNATREDTLHEMLSKVDIVSLHVDGRPSNDEFFGAAEFAAMRTGALFLNLSRGKVVDLAALSDAVRSGHISGAALDVYPEEPRGKGEQFVCILQNLPNVILTPHIGGSTLEAQHDIGRYVAGKIRDYVNNGNTMMSVNLPQLSLSQDGSAGRIAFLHDNVPGVMARVNGVFHKSGANITGQILDTQGDIGYLVTDISQPLEEEFVAEMRQMQETIRLRVL